MFATDDNEHHLQLKIGVNKWEDIREVKLNKVTSVADVQSVYDAMFAIPEDVYAIDFVVQDFRTSKVRPCCTRRVLWAAFCASPRLPPPSPSLSFSKLGNRAGHERRRGVQDAAAAYSLYRRPLPDRPPRPVHSSRCLNRNVHEAACFPLVFRILHSAFRRAAGIRAAVTAAVVVQTENNSGNDFQLKLVGAPTEEEVLERRAQEFEAAERDRVAQIAAAEAEIAEQIAEERRTAESDAMHEWWRSRRAELRAQAAHIVDAEISGHVDGCADQIEVRTPSKP